MGDVAKGGAQEAAAGALGAALAPMEAPSRGPARGSAAVHARALAHVKQELNLLPEVLTSVEGGLTALHSVLAPLGRPQRGTAPEDPPDTPP